MYARRQRCPGGWADDLRRTRAEQSNLWATGLNERQNIAGGVPGASRPAKRRKRSVIGNPSSRLTRSAQMHFE